MAILNDRNKKPREREDETVKIRDYINSYGGQYGITNDMIGWDQSTDPQGGGNVMLGGQTIASVRGDQIKDGSSYGSKNQIQSAIDNYAKQNKLSNMKATYENPYSDKVDNLLNQILNYENFNYNPNRDQSFKAYQQQYERAGSRAMEDTIGAAAGMTGGRTNSWSETVAGQAKAQWDDRLMDRIPELEAAAYNRYLNDRNMNVQNLQQLMAMDQQNYSRFADDRNFNRNTFESDRGFNRGVLESDRNFDFNRNVDQRNYDRSVLESDRGYDRNVLESDRSYDYQVSRDQVLDNRWLQQFDYQQQQDIIQQALQSRQISVSEANTALSRSRFDYEKQRDQVMDQRYADEIERSAKKAGASEEESTEIAQLHSFMMSSEDPESWLRERASQGLITDKQWKELVKYLPQEEEAY